MKNTNVETGVGGLAGRMGSACAAALLIGCIPAFALEAPSSIKCEGSYGGHLQGTDARGTNIWWSFTKTIVRTDLSGRVLASCDAPPHQGDLCVKGDTLYVAVNRGRFNTETEGESYVYSFDAMTLAQKRIWRLDMPMGAGGMTWRGDRFYVVGGLPPTHRVNYVHEYDTDFRLVRRHELNTGFTVMGIQTATIMDGEFLFGIYGGKGNLPGVLRCSPDFRVIRRYVEGGSTGFAKINGRMYTGSSPKILQDGKQRWTGTLLLSENFLADAKLLTNAWCEKGVFTDAPVNAAMVEVCAANGDVELKFGDAWRESMKELAAKGHNAVFIDFACGYRYPSHPELAVKGAWSEEDVTQALDVAREEGLEPIPYMDFTSPRNSWLGAKNLPAASKESLDFCCDLIKDLVNVFGRARYFRIKTDGLSDETVRALNDAIIDRGYGSCPWSLKGASAAAR